MTTVRHAVIVRVAIALSLLLGAASALFAWTVRRPGTPTAARGDSERETSDEIGGRVLFHQHCAACHTQDELRAVLDRDVNRARAAVTLLEFLDDHGDSTAADDRAIVLHLLERP